VGTTHRGRVAVVTGGGRGIGRAIALELAREGANVGLLARSQAELDGVAAELAALGQKAAVATADLVRPEQTSKAFAALAEALGPADLLVNAAGAARPGAFVKQDETEWWQLVETNLKSAYLCTRAVVPGMVQRRYGRIVFLGSVFSKLGFPQNTAYCAAKHGLIGLTRSLALELVETGVTVNAVCPGFVKTRLLEEVISMRAAEAGLSEAQIAKGIADRSPHKALLTPEEIVPAVMFLLSDGAARTTGEALNVSSGLAMH
jgi:3-hydroxybutyrate dehydrogenase